MSETSQAALDANRANAQKSSGPKTEAGKAKVSQNGVKHGFAGRRPLIRPEEKDEFVTLWTGLLQSFKPTDAAEMQFFDQLADAAWALRRIAKNEIELFAKSGGVDPMISPDPYLHKQHATLMRYKNDHTRIYNRAYKELIRLKNHRQEQQTLRATQAAAGMDEQPAPASAPPASSAAEPEKTNQTQTVMEQIAQTFSSAIDNEMAATRNDLAQVIQNLGALRKA